MKKQGDDGGATATAADGTMAMTVTPRPTTIMEAADAPTVTIGTVPATDSTNPVMATSQAIPMNEALTATTNDGPNKGARRQKTVTWADGVTTSDDEQVAALMDPTTSTGTTRPLVTSDHGKTQEPVERERDPPRSNMNGDTTSSGLGATRRKPTGSEAVGTLRSSRTRGRSYTTPTNEDANATVNRDAEIIEEQSRSKMVQQMLRAGPYHGRAISKVFGLVVVETPNKRRIVLSPALWATVLKECHDSVWSGYLRATHTYARIAQQYWWPNLRDEVRRWVLGCQECGSRKARPREVVPPLRSIRGGDVGDRWALDVAGPLPATDGGDRYVIAAVEYVTRYVVAIAVKDHTAENIADFLMKQVVLRFGPFREILTDGTPELVGKVIKELVTLLQAQQINPVPYRPQMIGLVERFHRTWKDCVATYMSDERQRDWDTWVDYAVYAYNSGRHSTVLISPNELMMGRRLRAPNERLRATRVTEAGDLVKHQQQLLDTLKEAHECAERSRTREQQRQARYYDRKVRTKREFEPGDRVWMFRPPRGPKSSKFVHQWIGPLRVVEPAGYENFLVEREDDGPEQEQFIAHVSFLVTYRRPTVLLEAAAQDLVEQLEYENECTWREDDEATASTTRAVAAPVNTAIPRQGKKRNATAVANESAANTNSGLLVEIRRRRRRNRAGQYVLEYQLQSVDKWTLRRGTRHDSDRHDPSDDEGRWYSVAEYDDLFNRGKVVEDLGVDGGV